MSEMPKIPNSLADILAFGGIKSIGKRVLHMTNDEYAEFRAGRGPYVYNKTNCLVAQIKDSADAFELALNGPKPKPKEEWESIPPATLDEILKEENL